MREELHVGFVGNPNCGKTTLFNAYTGAKLKVANWPGVTVEKKEGAMRYHNERFKLVDLPGIYSLTSYTLEEKLTRQYILEDDVDVIIDVADASSLERNLYLTLQLIELGKPVILALNMMDIVEERGMEIDLHRLPEMLGIPVIPVSARKKTGLDILMHAVSHHKDKLNDNNLEHHHIGNQEKDSEHVHEHHKEYAVVYSDEIEDKIDSISEILLYTYPGIKNVRWHAIKLLEQDEEIMERYPVNLSGIVDRNYETDIINQKYDFIEEIIEEVLVNKSKKEASTDKVDRILTHRFWGMPIFFAVIGLVFFLTFSIGNIFAGYFEGIISSFSELVLNFLISIHAGDILTSLVVDGIIAGVGGILTFLPNIAILFLALAILEDSGYMARVAYVMNGIMGKIGLSGRAFIPMLLGFGCTVPAVMASRTLENIKDRRKTIFVTPFMSCSAKIPIYVLFSGMFFKKNAALVALSMYVIGLIIGILAAYIMNKIDKQEEGQISTLLIELPEYKAPNVRTILIYVWDKIKDYLSKAGTTIFLASVIIWFILNFGTKGMVTDMSQSFGASIGRFLVPVLAPAGLGLWQIGVALISGLAAKEVVVASFGILFGIADINTASGMTQLSHMLQPLGFGTLNAFALMLFCLLYTPCAAAVGVIAKELKSLKLTLFTILFQLVIAWAVATIVYQIGSLI
ncbi:MAG: ferrous iron transport protein B [Anaerocolumna aminovalerica]|uniref:ferrous iron transport protein B n=1 Tax=Anaerocolumna aminovalerica TaxID=1527 RepID=UPI000BE3A9AE|nr:ferrous iron transport protein B [Anaerocolumna aminovalerica]MBU5332387.1 ferrous iron transport protein B [Anaerocolumna aminovalerica]MDU6266261.1 ferrous iron transport protein B [Anaerocolumna aminovalerica]